MTTTSKPKRQRRSGDGGATTTTTTSASTEEVAAIKVVEFDPDGTLGIARGGTKRGAVSSAAAAQRESKEQLLHTLNEEQKKQVDTHLHGNQGDLAVARREHLKRDDLNPDVKSLTANQQRHLKQRKNKKTVAVLERLETKRFQAAVSAVQAVSILQDTAAAAGLLETETDMERTTAVTQTQLRRHFLDAATARNIFDLQLPTTSAPYMFQYDRSGRYSVLAGKASGHVAIMDNAQRSLVTEFHLSNNERIRDVTFLHNFTLTAVAQRNHVYIYDHTGAEIHCLDQHSDPCKLAFLPYHWLLASVGRAGYLKYQDVSTGALVSTHRTQLAGGSSGSAKTTALVQNPANAVLHAGHANGTVTLWSPAQQQYLVKLQCHKGGAAITDVAVDLEGRTMVTAGLDRQIGVWDLRTYQLRHAYYCSAGVPASLDISQRGLLAVGHAGHVTIWSAEALQTKVQSPYMHHVLGPAGGNAARGPVATVRFRPFEDGCGIGHAAGVSGMVVPGSGEPALDTAEYHTNPAADVKQRREAEVRALLDKLSPDMIALDSNAVGGMEESDPATRLERLQDLQDAANGNPDDTQKQKGKKRGRSKIQTKLRRKHKNIIDQNLLRLRDAREKETLAKQIEGGSGSAGAGAAVNDTTTSQAAKESAPIALKRFF